MPISGHHTAFNGFDDCSITTHMPCAYGNEFSGVRIERPNIGLAARWQKVDVGKGNGHRRIKGDPNGLNGDEQCWIELFR